MWLYVVCFVSAERVLECKENIQYFKSGKVFQPSRDKSITDDPARKTAKSIIYCAFYTDSVTENTKATFLFSSFV